MLKMSLDEIKGKIQIYPEYWFNFHTTNCYAYALGLDIPEYKICSGAYQPGTISQSANIRESEYFSKVELLKGLRKDLEILNVSYREVCYDTKIEEDEWKIALLFEKYYGNLIDFHFLRENKNGNWFHKNGFNGIITKKDHLGRIITNPETAFLSPYTFDSCYALKIKK